MRAEHCKHCQATDRAKAPAKCEKSADGRHSWTISTDPSHGSTPTPGGGKPATTTKGKT